MTESEYKAILLSCSSLPKTEDVSKIDDIFQNKCLLSEKSPMYSCKYWIFVGFGLFLEDLASFKLILTFTGSAFIEQSMKWKYRYIWTLPTLLPSTCVNHRSLKCTVIVYFNTIRCTYLYLFLYQHIYYEISILPYSYWPRGQKQETYFRIYKVLSKCRNSNTEYELDRTFVLYTLGDDSKSSSSFWKKNITYSPRCLGRYHFYYMKLRSLFTVGARPKNIFLYIFIYVYVY